MIPSKFYVTGGKAIDPISSLNALDKSLLNAQIGNYNMVCVSSILSANIEELSSPVKQPIGSIINLVLAHMEGNEGETISAGLIWGYDNKKNYGIVAEGHGYMDKRKLKEILDWKIKKMAEYRRMNLTSVKVKTETLSVKMDNYGSVVVGLVFLT